MATDPHSQATTCDGDLKREHQKGMIAACNSGNLARLQELLKATGVKKGDSPVELHWISHPTEAPPSCLIAHVVEYKHSELLACLLDIYPYASTKTDLILRHACANPDLPTSKLLHARDPSVVDHEFYTGGTLFIETCHTGDPLLPSFLLDQDADPNGIGQGTSFPPLETAIMSKQPLWLIEKLVTKGASVRLSSLEIQHRSKKELGHILTLIPDCPTNIEQSCADTLAKVRDSGDKELIASLKKWIKRVKRRQALREKSAKAGKPKQKSWWQRFLGRWTWFSRRDEGQTLLQAKESYSGKGVND